MGIVIGLALAGFLLLGLLVVVAAMGSARASRAVERQRRAVPGPRAWVGGPAPAHQLRVAPDDGAAERVAARDGRDQAASARGTG